MMYPPPPIPVEARATTTAEYSQRAEWTEATSTRPMMGSTTPKFIREEIRERIEDRREAHEASSTVRQEMRDASSTPPGMMRGEKRGVPFRVTNFFRNWFTFASTSIDVSVGVEATTTDAVERPVPPPGFFKRFFNFFQ